MIKQGHIMGQPIRWHVTPGAAPEIRNLVVILFCGGRITMHSRPLRADRIHLDTEFGRAQLRREMKLAATELRRRAMGVIHHG